MIPVRFHIQDSTYADKSKQVLMPKRKTKRVQILTANPPDNYWKTKQYLEKKGKKLLSRKYLKTGARLRHLHCFLSCRSF